MRISFFICTMFMIAVFGLIVISIAPAAHADGLPNFLYSKGGIIYPHTGDSTQEIFRTPANVKDFIEPGMLIGVLPEDCRPASRGTIGDYYSCNHELALKPEERYGKTVYRVIEAN
jgi:hypothetical protein